MPSDPVAEGRPRGIPESPVFALCAILYVAAALGVDTLAFYEVEFIIDWSIFKWLGKDLINLLHDAGLTTIANGLTRTPFHNFDIFKFLVWLVLPVLACAPWMDWRAWGFSRWKRVDWYLLGGLCIGSIGLVMLIPWLPGVSDMYRPADLPARDKVLGVTAYLIWTLSWLPGWEFLHRYLLLRSLQRLEIRFEWLIVPVVEALYHLPKHFLEMAGMFLFGLLATRWVNLRGSWMLPLLVHLAIEVALAMFMVGLFTV